MLIQFCLVFALGSALADLADVREFEALEALYNAEGQLKSDSHTRKLRFSNFLRSKAIVRKINEDPSRKFTATVNKLSLMTTEERQSLVGLNISLMFPMDEETVVKLSRPVLTNIPESVDWSTNLPPIKDQKQCGSCWTFAGTAAMEAEYYRVAGETVSFSEQEVMDCSTADTSFWGCTGGIVSAGMKYVERHGRVASSEVVQYKGKKTECDYDKYPSVLRNARIKETVKVFSKGEDDLVLEALSVRPVGGGMDVTASFYEYGSGIFDESGPVKGNTGHAIALVGYGSNKLGKFWKIRNSWGVVWGMKGYGLISRETKNFLQLSHYFVHPVMERCDGDCPDPIPWWQRGKFIIGPCDDEWPTDCRKHRNNCPGPPMWFPWIKPGCPRTCGDPRCRSRDDGEKTLIDLGVCEDLTSPTICRNFADHCEPRRRYHAWMQHFCRKTCGVCGKKDQTPKGKEKEEGNHDEKENNEEQNENGGDNEDRNKGQDNEKKRRKKDRKEKKRRKGGKKNRRRNKA